MKKRIDMIASSLLVFLGVGHTVLTPNFYKGFEPDALWFAGTGLALIYLGVLNLVRLFCGIRRVTRVVLLANLVWLVYNGLIVLLIREPQAFVAIGLTLLLCGLNAPQLFGETEHAG